MPAKPLTDEQRRDAERLRAQFRAWQSARKERGEPSTQDEVAESLFGFGQSALSQYINGKIPLNAEALHKFATVLGVQASNISPGIVRDQLALSGALSSQGASQAPAPVAEAPPSGQSRKQSHQAA